MTDLHLERGASGLDLDSLRLLEVLLDCISIDLQEGVLVVEEVVLVLVIQEHQSLLVQERAFFHTTQRAKKMLLLAFFLYVPTFVIAFMLEIALFFVQCA